MINPRVEDKPSTAVAATTATGIYQTGTVQGRPVLNADPRPSAALTLAGVARFWRFIAVVVGTCVAATAGYVALVPTKWEASAHILVEPVPADADPPGSGLISDSVEPARSLQTAVALLDTPAADAATAAEMGAPWSAASVERGIVVQPLGESYVVEVKAQADSPSTAARLATAFAESTLATRNAEVKKRAATLLALRAGLISKPISATQAQLALLVRTGDPSLSLAQPASTPTSPAGLSAPYKIALSAVLGLCLAIACVWARIRGARPDERRRVLTYAPDDDGGDR